MDVNLLNLDNQVVGTVPLNDELFAQAFIRVDIIKRVVDWQRMKAMSGTHKAKTISEVSGTTKKPFKQKGTGNARQGSLRSVQMRGGAISHGPVVRSHEIKLPKKVRALGMKCALSSKIKNGSLFVLEDLKMSSPKTAELAKKLKSFSDGRVFIIGGKETDQFFGLSVRSLPNVRFVPAVGANVYDIINSDCVILSQHALPVLEARLRCV